MSRLEEAGGGGGRESSEFTFQALLRDLGHDFTSLSISSSTARA